MARIAINGMSAKSGGGRSVLRNILGSLIAAGPTHDYLLVVPAGAGYQEFAHDRIEVFEIPGLDGLAQLTRFALSGFPRLLCQRQVELLFNPSDIPMKTAVKQVFLFDWPYAAFPESPALALASPRDRMVRRVKQWLFERHLPYVDVLAAQTDVIAERLARLYGHDDIAIIPNAVALENLSGGDAHDFALGDGFKLLCLSAYYTHKNIEIFLPVAAELKRRGLAAKIIVTLNADQHPAAAQFLAAVRQRGLGDMIISVGSVPMARVPALYAQTDALILPTLLESFSGTYVEAMFHGRPILTSDLPFATGVCGDAALYVDPMEPAAMTDAIARLNSDAALRATLVARGHERLAAMPDWATTTAKLVGIFDRVLAGDSRGRRG